VLCGEIAPPALCKGEEDIIIAKENFEDADAVKSWFYANVVSDSIMTSFLVPVGDETAKTFSVPVDAPAVSVTFDMYELADSESIFLRVQDSYPSLGAFAKSSANDMFGYFADIRASVVSQGETISQVTLLIPASWYPKGRLTIGVKGSVGIDNLVLTSICEQSSVPFLSPTTMPTGAPLAYAIAAQMEHITSNPTDAPIYEPSIAATPSYGVNYTYTAPTVGTCSCSCATEESTFTPDSWAYMGLPVASLVPVPAFYDTDASYETASCMGLAESATHPRVAMPCNDPDTVYYLVQDGANAYEKLSALKFRKGAWSYVGGSRYVSYDDNRVKDASHVPDIKVAEGECAQTFDLQARDNELCMVFSDKTASVGGDNIINPEGTPLVYCFDETDGKWRELGWQNRIGVAGDGDIELLMPSACECSNLSSYYFVMVGRASTGHLETDVVNAAVVWYYNSADPEAGWRPLGGDSENAMVIPGGSSDAHLALTGTGNFACAVHAVVSDDSGLKRFDVYGGDKHLVVARFEPGVETLPVVTAEAECVATHADGSATACFPMKAGQHMDAGKVCATIINGDIDEVEITYDTSAANACLKEVQAYIGHSIPSGADGNPKVGNFPAKASIPETCATKYTVRLPLSTGCSATDFDNKVYKLAAHATVKFIGGTEETAWSIGKDIIVGGSWATYSEVLLDCKCGSLQSISYASTSDDGFNTGSWFALDELIYEAAYTGVSNSAKRCTNDFVFTESGIPAVAWIDAENSGFAYLSIWPGYPSALVSETHGFEVAAHSGVSAGAIPPISSTKPGYLDASGLTIDANGDAVFVAITDNASKKVFISYIDLAAATLEWKMFETETADLLPQDQVHALCSDSLTSQTVASAQNHIKVACNGDILVGHIIAKNSAPFNLASLAVNGSPLNALAPAAPATCADGVDQVITSENFELYDDSSPTWTNGLKSDTAELGHFLGPLKGSGGVISKSFTVPSEASSVTFSFEFYDIDGLGSGQVLYTTIDTQRIDLAFPKASAKSGSTGGIVWSYVSSGKMFTTTMTIPRSYYSTDGTLSVQFDLYHSTPGDATKRTGLDKISLVADCSSARRATESNNENEGAGHYYCSSGDFPCGRDNGQLVHVCHYSSRLGYQTFCVPEPDSEVLRFYKNDYCGPCVQGFGGVNSD
jgi:hypothetical protein